MDLETSFVTPSPTVELAESTKAIPKSSSFVIWAALLVTISTIFVFVAQVAWAKMLVTPWYLPLIGTVSALVVLRAIAIGFSWWRICVGLVCVAIAAFEWFFILMLTVLPSYSGPIAQGKPVPSFKASLADGSEFDETHLKQNRASAMIFFQGRWCPFCMTQLRELEAHHEEFARIGAKVFVVSIEDQKTASETQHDFPHLVVVSDEQRELSNAVDLINRGVAPDGGDIAVPTVILVDRSGVVQWIQRPKRFISRPSAREIITTIEKQIAR